MIRAARRLVPLVAIAALAACGANKVCTPTGQLAAGPPPPDWRATATDQDHAKLRELRTVFLDGLAQARAAGFGKEVDAGGRLFDPDAAQDGAALQPGDYRCRTYSLGTKVSDRPAFVAGTDGFCRITPADRIERFDGRDGPQRLTGRIFPDEPSRTVFLGTRMLGDEASPIHYSRDQDRDTIGAIQRIGEARWRMVIPSPAWGSKVQVVEIVPGVG
jgi:hypothetical protein